MSHGCKPTEPYDLNPSSRPSAHYSLMFFFSSFMPRSHFFSLCFESSYFLALWVCPASALPPSQAYRFRRRCCCFCWEDHALCKFAAQVAVPLVQLLLDQRCNLLVDERPDGVVLVSVGRCHRDVNLMRNEKEGKGKRARERKRKGKEGKGEIRERTDRKKTSDRKETGQTASTSMNRSIFPSFHQNVTHIYFLNLVFFAEVWDLNVAADSLAACSFA